MKRLLLTAALLGVVAAAAVAATLGGRASTSASALPAPRPTLDGDYAQVGTGTATPTETDCINVSRRCFTPDSIRAAYNLMPLYDGGDDGTGQTIAIIDSYGSDTMAHDLHVFDTAFGLRPMCGEEGVTCGPGMPTFGELAPQGSPATKAPPPTAGNQGKSAAPSLEDKSAWAIEVALDVEWAHTVAPGANILLVHTPTAETLGVQGFPQMMAAEDYVVKHHLATVISQSLAAAEESFGSTQSLLNLRYAFEDAKDAGVTVLGSSGDGGTANETKQPTNLFNTGANTIPFPTVEWPASDPLVTGVGGTYLCADPITGLGVDSTDPPARCQANPGVREVGWIASGGGFSHVFARPGYQDGLPAGSTTIPSDQRGVPDVAYNASALTGVLIYVSLPPFGGGTNAGSPNTSGWYIIGGTSAGSPQWAGLIAIADQMNGGGLGLINPALYEIGSDPSRYAADFYDVTTGSNATLASFPNDYPATAGWDPVTGLGTPNAANLLPDLVAAVRAG